MNNKSNRSTLKKYFVKKAIPTEKQFAELIDSVPNIEEDGEIRFRKNGLALYSKVKEKEILELYEEKPKEGKEKPCWSFSIGSDKSLLLKNENDEVVLSISQDKKISIEKLETNEISSIGVSNVVSMLGKVRIDDLNAGKITTSEVDSPSDVPLVFPNPKGIKCEKISVDNICHNKDNTVSISSNVKVSYLNADKITTSEVDSQNDVPLVFPNPKGIKCEKISVDNICHNRNPNEIVSILSKVKTNNLDAVKIIASEVGSPNDVPLVFPNPKGVKCATISVDDICHNNNKNETVTISSKVKIGDLNASKITTSEVNSPNDAPLVFPNPKGVKCENILVDNICHNKNSNGIKIKTGLLFDQLWDTIIDGVDGCCGVIGHKGHDKRMSGYLCSIMPQDLYNGFFVFEVLCICDGKLTISIASCNYGQLNDIVYINNSNQFRLTWQFHDNAYYLFLDTEKTISYQMKRIC